MAAWLPSVSAQVQLPAIAPRPLSEALETFATQSGIQLVYRSELARGVLSEGADAWQPPAETMRQLLRGTGLTFSFLNDRTIAIYRLQSTGAKSPFAAASAQEASELPDSGVVARNLESSAGGNDETLLAEGTMKHRGLLARIGGAIFAFMSGPTMAQQAQGAGTAATDTLEEIVVTAERRSSDLQKTAASISVRSGDALQEQGRTTLDQILEDVPGVLAGSTSFKSDNAGLSISIRGVPTNNSNTAVSPVPTTASYTDGVYEGIGGNYDIERVEVLRGPQGTLYGRSATSGVVATHTRNPMLGSFGGNVSAELGNYDLQHYSGAVNLPAGETFAARVAADQYERNGYYNGSGGEVQRTSVRIKMLYQPIEDLTLLVGAASEDNTIHSGGTLASITTPNHFTYTPASILDGKNFSRQYWAELNWNIGPVTLSYLPAYRKWNQEPSGTSQTLAGLQYIQNQTTPLDQFVTHELRLASNDPNAKLTWLVGAFYYDNRLNYFLNLDWPQSGGYLVHNQTRKETQDVGLFAEGTFHFTDDWRLTAGLRYDYTYVQTLLTKYTNPNSTCYTPIAAAACPNRGTVDPTRAGTPAVFPAPLLIGPDIGTRRFYNVTYKGRLEHDLTPANMLYAMISSGFLPGDVQISGSLPQQFDEEILTAFEIGSKNRFLNDRLQLNADVFYYRYSGYQRTVVPTGAPTISYLATVPVRMVGGELETIYQLTADDRLGLSYANTDAYYVDKPTNTFLSGATATTFGVNVSQQELAGVVPQTLSLSYDHTFRLPGGSRIVARADARRLWAHYASDLNMYFVNSGITSVAVYKSYVWIPSQIIGNVSTTWSSASDRLSVTAYVRNVSDTRYATTVAVNATNPVTFTGTESDPRTYGAVISARF